MENWHQVYGGVLFMVGIVFSWALLFCCVSMIYIILYATSDNNVGTTSRGHQETSRPNSRRSANEDPERNQQRQLYSGALMNEKKLKD